jgi:hypothetical protein
MDMSMIDKLRLFLLDIFENGFTPGVSIVVVGGEVIDRGVTDKNIYIGKFVQSFSDNQVIPLVRPVRSIVWDSLPSADEPVPVLSDSIVDILDKFWKRLPRVMVAFNGKDWLIVLFLNLLENRESHVPAGKREIEVEFEFFLIMGLVIISYDEDFAGIGKHLTNV